MQMVAALVKTIEASPESAPKTHRASAAAIRTILNLFEWFRFIVV